MATAKSYDAFHDAGMAFSETDCKSYDPQAWAEARVNELLKRQLVFMRRAELGEAEAWWKAFATAVQGRIGWYCVAMEIPRPPAPQLPDAKSAEGKRLTAKARALSPADAVGYWATDAERQMVFVVSIGRACIGNKSVSGWKKIDGKRSNKLANAVNTEINVGESMRQQLEARTGKEQVED